MTDQHTEPRPPIGGMGQPGEGNPVIRILAVVGLLIGLGVVFGVLATLLVVLALVLIIFLHELGHFVTAKASGMKVTEFFLGFGPELWSFQRGETTYGVKAIPAGAYVRIIGMNNLEEVDPADEPRTYRSKSFPRRLSVAVAGSAMHFLLAVLLMWVALVAYGVSELDAWEVDETAPVPASEESEEVPSPAQQVGLQPGDRIVAVDGDPVPAWTDLTDMLVDHPGETLTLTVVRDDQARQVRVTLATVPDEETGEARGFLGISPQFPPQPVPPLEAVPEAGAGVADWTWRSVAALGSFFSPSNLSDYADRVANPDAASDGEGSASAEPADDGNRFISPVGFVRIASQAADTGVYNVLLLLVLINVFVGVFNMVPLLPFDGGHVAIATYERIRSRRGHRYHADVTKMLPFVYGVVMILGLMFLTSLWLDIASPIENPFESP